MLPSSVSIKHGFGAYSLQYCSDCQTGNAGCLDGTQERLRSNNGYPDYDVVGNLNERVDVPSVIYINVVYLSFNFCILPIHNNTSSVAAKLHPSLPRMFQSWVVFV